MRNNYSLFHNCGDKQCQWPASQEFGNFGCCGEARLNDLHRVVVSYRPALKARAGDAETQAEEMDSDTQAVCTVVALQHMSDS